MSTYDSICCFRNRGNMGYRILMEITDLCNQRCVFCHGKSHHSLSLDQIKTIVGHIQELTVKDIILTGGEPLLHRQLFGIMDWLRRAGIDIDLCTNGTLVDTQKAYQLKKYLSEISVSLDSAVREKYDYLRGVAGDYDKVLQGIRNLQDAGLEVHLTCVVNRENKEEIMQISSLAHALGVHSVSFLGLIVNVAKSKEQALALAVSSPEKDQVIRLICDAREKYPELHINTKRLVPCPEERCKAGENILGITSDGKLLSCIMHRDSLDEPGFDLLREPLRIEWLQQLRRPIPC